MIQRFSRTQRRIFTERMIDEMRRWISPWPKTVVPESRYALIEGGTMGKGSLSFVIYEKLMASFKAQYSDHPEKEALLSSITANFNNETEAAWTAFIAEIGDDDEQD